MQAKSLCARAGEVGSKITESERTYFMDDPLIQLSEMHGAGIDSNVVWTYRHLKILCT